MDSSEKKFPTASLAIGAVAALAFAYYQFTNVQKPEDQERLPPVNRAKADLEDPSGPKVSTELRKEIGAEEKDEVNTALRLQENAKQKFSQDNYDEVTDLLELALEVLKGAGESNSIHSANITFDLGFYRFHNNEIPKAREAFNKAYELYIVNSQDEKGFDALDMLALTYGQNPTGGEVVFEKIIQKRLEKGGDADPALANAYIQYGLWHIKNKKDELGVKSLEKASQVLERNSGKSKSEDLVPIYNQLLNAYKAARAYSEGMKVSSSAIKYLDINRNPELLNDIANLYSEGNESKQSVEYYRKYLDALKASGRENFLKGKTIKNIASEYEKQKADPEALASWSEFSGLYKSSDSKEVALMSIYGQLRAFALYNRRGKVGEATKELEDASAKTKELLGKDHMYSQAMNKIVEKYKNNQAANERLDVESLTLMLIALEDNLQKLIDTGFINL